MESQAEGKNVGTQVLKKVTIKRTHKKKEIPWRDLQLASTSLADRFHAGIQAGFASHRLT